MWIEVEDEVIVEKLQKFLEFRIKDSEETELYNDYGTMYGYSNIYQLPGVKYELISFLTNEDAFVLRYWKDASIGFDEGSLGEDYTVSSQIKGGVVQSVRILK